MGSGGVGGVEVGAGGDSRTPAAAPPRTRNGILTGAAAERNESRFASSERSTRWAPIPSDFGGTWAGVEALPSFLRQPRKPVFFGRVVCSVWARASPNFLAEFTLARASKEHYCFFFFILFHGQYGARVRIGSRVARGLP
jgi:hypothetical protein